MKFSFSNIGKRIREIFIGEAGSSSAQITNSNIKNFLIKHVGWGADSDDYTASENDLEEVKSAINTDSYIKVALDKTAQLIMKSGYKFESDNENALEYLRQRIAMMEFGSKIPFDILLEEIARNLVYYSNCFVVKSRIDKIQGGLQAKPVLGKKPVGGYFIMDPTMVEIKRDKNGAVSGYKLSATEEKEFKADDVIHFYVDRDASNSFGTPRIISSLEDVKILRKIEGNTLSLIYRFSIPLYQMKIGLPETNFMATDNEISEAQKQINKMPMDGIIVTNERTQFLAIGADGKAIDLSPYLSYYEKRVFTGLNVSEAMMGRGGSKQDADSMEGLMHDTVKHYQIAMKAFIEKEIFNEILLEGGFNPIFNIEDRVNFKFNEINLDSRVKYENHLINQFQTDAITFEEMRQGLGRDSDNVDENRLFTNMITVPAALAQIQAKNTVAASTGNGNINNGKTSAVKGSGTVKSTANPTNQHGTTSAKIKEGEQQWHAAAQKNPPRRNPLARNLPQRNPARSANSLNVFREKYSSLCNSFNAMRNDILSKGIINNSLTSEYGKALNKDLEKITEAALTGGLEKSQSAGQNVSSYSISPEIKKAFTEKYTSITDSLLKELEEKEARGEIKNLSDYLDLVEQTLYYRTDNLIEKAFFTGLLTGYEKQGIEKIELELEEAGITKKQQISTAGFHINSIPNIKKEHYKIFIPEAAN